MKILAALDSSSQSSFVVKEVARLAANTWADVTLLGIEGEAAATDKHHFTPKNSSNREHPLVLSLRRNRSLFLDQFDPEHSPYRPTCIESKLVETESGCWEDLQFWSGAVKKLKTCLRPGNPARAVLTEAHNSQCDMIVIGNSAQTHEGNLTKSLKKIILEAETSLLMLAEAKKPKRIVACLDHDNVSQPSLEMVNQMVTLYDADLEIVGLTTKDVLSSDVDQKMGQILKYYTANKIKALVRLADINLLETFATQAARENLIALWMGKQSLLSRFFHPRYVDKLLSTSDSSLLILR